MHSELGYGWHYNIVGESSDTNSLANYLQLSSADYREILVTTGLATVRINKCGKECLHIIKNVERSPTNYSWEQFLNENKMESNYFDRKFVKDYMPSIVNWIGLGPVLKSENPRTQFNTNKRRQRTKPIHFSKSMIQIRRSFINMILLKQQFTSSHADNKHQSSSVSSSPPNEKENIINTMLKQSRLNGFDKASAAAIEYVKSMWSLSLQQQKEALTNLEVGATDFIDKSFKEIEVDDASYPLLSQLQIPISKHVISTLLKELVALSNSLPNDELLTYDTHYGSKCHLLSIPNFTSYVST